MNIGDVMVIAATLASLAAFAGRIQSYRSGDKRLESVSVALSFLTFVLLTVMIVFLGYLFLTSDASYFYVWSNSSSDLSSVYKLSGIWSGADGSFLLWIWFMSLVLAAEVLLEPRRSYLSKKFHGVFQASMSGVIFLFMLLLANMNLFERTNSILLQYAPNGSGMELVLQTPEMILHPPIVFAGYAFCIATFSAGVAYYLTRDSNWTSVSLPWGRLAWLFLTLGIGIGAIWAYYVLGWGGYWAWDPVETGSLLPWLVATAFLHTQLRHSRKGEYRVLSPVLGMLTFVAVVFATFVTRAGSIWTASVHSFGASVGSSAGARLTYLLQHDSTVLGIFTLMLLLLFFSIYLAYDKYRRQPRPDEEPEPLKMSEYVDDKNNMLFTVALLVATSAIMLFLMFKNVNVSQEANLSEFNQKMSLFFVILMATLSICLAWRSLGSLRALILGASVIVFSIVLALVSAASGQFDWLVAFSLPAYALAVFISGLNIFRSRVKGSARKSLQKLSPQIVHLGVALVLLSFVVSSNLQVFPSSVESVSGASGSFVNVGGDVSVGDYTVRLVDLRSSSSSGSSGGMTINAAREAVVDLLRSGDTIKSNIVVTNLYGVDSNGAPHVLQTDVYIHKSVFNDLYLDYQWVDNSTAFIQVKLVPMMNFLWAGFGLLAIGLGIRTVVWKQEPKTTKEDAEIEPAKQKPSPTTDKTATVEKDYEAKVEEELRKFKERRSK